MKTNSKERTLWNEGGAKIYVSHYGSIGIEVNGHVIWMDVAKWHALGKLRCALDDIMR